MIVPSCHEAGEVISPIFICPKKDGSHRMILNLKHLNNYVEYHHFKMDTLWSVIKSMTPNCSMSTVDLKDAYYSVPLSPGSQKLLKFIWKGQLYQCTCLPNGLSSCPRKFTMLLKPVYTVSRQQGHVSSGMLTYRVPHMKIVPVMWLIQLTYSPLWGSLLIQINQF